jgi:hypothetical protein
MPLSFSSLSPQSFCTTAFPCLYYITFPFFFQPLIKKTALNSLIQSGFLWAFVTASGKQKKKQPF